MAWCLWGSGRDGMVVVWSRKDGWDWKGLPGVCRGLEGMTGTGRDAMVFVGDWKGWLGLKGMAWCMWGTGRDGWDWKGWHGVCLE